MKKCPFCAEEIQDEAIKCRYCGSMLDGSAPPPGSRPSGMDAEVLRFITAGRKLEAIKLVRQQTGFDLARAKHYVDALAAGRDPGQMPMLPPEPRSAGGGSGFMILVAIAVLAALAYWFMSGSRT